MNMQTYAVVPEARSRIGWRTALVFGGGLVLLAFLLFASLTQGVANISLSTVVAAITAPQDIPDHHMVRGLRMPRAVMAMIAGAALAVSGALLQTVTRNPLASAGTFGINAGAYFAVVVGTVFFPALLSASALPLALLGGCLGAGMAYLMAGGRKGTPVKMALAGMIVTLVLSAFTSAMQLLFENETNGLFMWGSGSVVQNNWSGVTFSAPWIALGLVVALWFSRVLDMLSLGEETARSLGQRVETTRLTALATAILLASVTVSVVGPIGFVGLIAPHLIRLIGFRKHSVLLTASALWGASILVGADTVARMFRSGIGELPAGAVTAVIGAPWLIWLAVRSARGSGHSETASSMSVGVTRRKLPVALLAGVLLVLLVLATVLGLSLGSLKIAPGEVVAVLTGHGQEMSSGIIFGLRLPRLIVSILAGAALAVAGLLLQSAVRNPLADPSVIGVTSGAGAGALVLLVVWPAATGQWMAVGALCGAVAAASIVYSISWRRGLNPTVLTLVGIGVTAAGSALVHVLVIRSGMTAAPALAWLAGSLYSRGWDIAIRLGISVAVLLPLAWLLGRRADLLAFGDQTSVGLGLGLKRTRLLTAALGVALAGISVASVGTVGFIGLLAPHAVRLLVGQNHRQSVVLAALLGALLLCAADIIGRVAIAPKEIPAGLVVCLVGTPYLLTLMYRSVSKR